MAELRNQTQGIPIEQVLEGANMVELKAAALHLKQVPGELFEASTGAEAVNMASVWQAVADAASKIASIATAAAAQARQDQPGPAHVSRTFL